MHLKVTFEMFNAAMETAKASGDEKYEFTAEAKELIFDYYDPEVNDWMGKCESTITREYIAKHWVEWPSVEEVFTALCSEDIAKAMAEYPDEKLTVKDLFPEETMVEILDDYWYAFALPGGTLLLYSPAGIIGDDDEDDEE